jgi:hypothetical protein
MVYDISYLEEIFTQHIINFCKMGYNFYSKCSGGSMKIYLSNGKRILCIRIESRKCIDGFFFVYKQELVIEVFNNFDTNILWNNKGEILNIYTFYVFDSKGKYKYTDDFEFAKEIEKKKCERILRNRPLSSVFHFDCCSSKLYRFVKSKKGYKTVKSKDIYKVVHEYCNDGRNNRNCYIIYIDKKPSIIFNFPIDK